jgi:predicted enzyme related to lactoylglutathione lyase
VSDRQRTRFECADPIFRVEGMAAAVRYYVDVLGFESASWGDDNFTCVSRDGAGIYLCRGAQGQTGSWVWVGVADAEALFEELKASGARIRHEPRNYPWALEMHVEDPDGNVLRMGSDSKQDRPYDDWKP